MTATAAPHSRWLVREHVERLAATYDDAANAITEFTKAAVRRSSAVPGPTAGQRIAGRRGWPRTIWFAATALLTTVFMAWISGRLVDHLTAAPGAVAVLPGVLLALALAGTAAQAAKCPLRAADADATVPSRPWLLLGAAVAAVFAWTSLWLGLTTGTSDWVAVLCGAVLAAAVTAGLLASSRPAAPPPPVVPHHARPLPRRVRARRRRAQRRLRDHSCQWTLAAHSYGADIDPGAEADALARLLAGDTDPRLENGDPYHILILTTLCRYRPAPLAASLDAAARLLDEDAPAGFDPAQAGTDMVSSPDPRPRSA